jgi:hypothetical protein
MVIIGFEDQDGKPVVMTEEEKKRFLEKSNMKKEDVIFADNIPSKVVIGLDLLSKGLDSLNKEKILNKE